VLLYREGWLVNRERMERLYRLEGLCLSRDRPRRRKSLVDRGPSVVDQYTRETLATEARGSLFAHDAIEVLDWFSRSHRKPVLLQVAHASIMGDGVRFARP
jgi:putative transposase